MPIPTKNDMMQQFIKDELGNLLKDAKYSVHYWRGFRIGIYDDKDTGEASYELTQESTGENFGHAEGFKSKADALYNAKAVISSVGKSADDQRPITSEDAGITDEQLKRLIEQERLIGQERNAKKSVNCGFCNSTNTALVKMHNDNHNTYTGDNIYQCFKCGSRFGINKL